MQYFDAHVHMQLMSNAYEVACECAARGIGTFACGVDPKTWEADCDLLADLPHVYVGAGLHPWWIADGRCGEDEEALLEQLCCKTRWIGEIGLDYLPKHAAEASWELQRACFERTCYAAVRASIDIGMPRVLSIHSVASAGAVLDALEKTGALEACRCVFHWYSGNTDDLWRAIRSGCWFSVNEMGLRTGKGREYAKLIPEDRLLTETDQPAELGGPWSAERIESSLSRAVELLATARNVDPEAVREQSVANAKALFA